MVLAKRSAVGAGKYAVHVDGTVTENRQRHPVSCVTLRDYMHKRTAAMPYERVLRMMELLRKQMTDLEVLHLSIPYYGLDDVLVINDVFFCFANAEKLFAYDASTRQLEVTRAINRSYAFYAPEIKPLLRALPYSVDYRASYYSLGLLSAYCALLVPELMSSTADRGADRGVADDDKDKDKDNDNDDAISGGRRNKNNKSQPLVVSVLDPLKYTKLYWFILRCCGIGGGKSRPRMLIFI
jgi:hypothetical protein